MIVLTSDHGDLLGERGMFFKMSFHEWSLRVPLLVRAPARFAPRRVAENVSLLDLAPTLVALAGGDPAPESLVEGADLGGLLRGDAADWPDRVLAEYTAEGSIAPLLMVREGRWKYVLGDPDPPQLFDLEADPDELRDLAGSRDARAVEERLRATALARWDPRALAERVHESQRRRRLVGQALYTGARKSWDHQPFRDAARQYYRLEEDIQDAYAVE